MAKKKKTQSRKTKNSLITLLACVIVLLSILFDKTGLWDNVFDETDIKTNQTVNYDGLSVHYLDVGQGDCEIIVCDDDIVVVDGGEQDASDTVIGYINTLGFDTIDCYIGTHPHSDHIGAAADIISSFTVENVIIPELSEINTPTTKVYKNMVSAITASGAKVYRSSPGDEYNFGDIYFQIISPAIQYEDLNNMSVAFRLVYGENSFLFMGDAETTVEKEILSSGLTVCSDVLKVGHHGSSTSSCLDFLEAVAPEYAIISCAKDNEYGHPHKKTTSNLSDLSVKTYITYNGTVVVTSDGKELAFSQNG